MELYFLLLAATVGGYVFKTIKTDLGGESQVRGVKNERIEKAIKPNKINISGFGK